MLTPSLANVFYEVKVEVFTEHLQLPKGSAFAWEQACHMAGVLTSGSAQQRLEIPRARSTKPLPFARN